MASGKPRIGHLTLSITAPAAEAVDVDTQFFNAERKNNFCSYFPRVSAHTTREFPRAEARGKTFPPGETSHMLSYAFSKTFLPYTRVFLTYTHLGLTMKQAAAFKPDRASRRLLRLLPPTGP